MNLTFPCGGLCGSENIAYTMQHSGLAMESKGDAHVCLQTRTLAMRMMYVKLAMCFIDIDTDVTEDMFVNALKQALRLSHGTVGGAVHIILHSFHESVGLLEVDKRELNKVADAAESMTEYEGQRCQLRIVQSSPCLAQLAFDSRAYMKELQ